VIKGNITSDNICTSGSLWYEALQRTQPSICSSLAKNAQHQLNHDKPKLRDVQQNNISVFFKLSLKRKEEEEKKKGRKRKDLRMVTDYRKLKRNSN